MLRGEPLPVLGGKGISPASLHYCVVALEFANNDGLIDWVRDSHSLFLGYDSTTVAGNSLQLVSWREVKIVRPYKDGTGTWKLGGDSTIILGAGPSIYMPWGVNW